jgi:hypothetical protein
MIACICGGLEFLLVIPIIVWVRKRFKWCQKSCECNCHRSRKKLVWFEE